LNSGVDCSHYVLNHVRWVPAKVPMGDLNSHALRVLGPKPKRVYHFITQAMQPRANGPPRNLPISFTYYTLCYENDR